MWFTGNLQSGPRSGADADNVVGQILGSLLGGDDDTNSRNNASTTGTSSDDAPMPTNILEVLSGGILNMMNNPSGPGINQVGGGGLLNSGGPAAPARGSDPQFMGFWAPDQQDLGEDPYLSREDGAFRSGA